MRKIYDGTGRLYAVVADYTTTNVAAAAAKAAADLRGELDEPEPEEPVRCPECHQRGSHDYHCSKGWE